MHNHTTSLRFRRFGAVLLVAFLLCLPLLVPADAQDREDPLVAFKFALEIEGTIVGYFTSVSMIGSQSDVTEEKIVDPGSGATIIRKSPGELTWLHVTLVRPATADPSAWSWRQQVIDGQINDARVDCGVVAIDQQNAEIARWEFLNAWPSRVSVSGSTTNTMFEELTFVHEGCIRGTLTVTNRYPRIVLPGPHVMPVLGTTNFRVTVSDPDDDIATLVSTLAPSGATFDGTNFTWTATLAHHDTVQSVQFRANDQKGTPTSIAIAETTITVPFDFDADTLGDDWEVVSFGDLTQPGAGDFDRDGADNAHEHGAGTNPDDPTSLFEVVGVAVSPGTSNVALRFSTEPGATYTVEFTDGPLTATPLSWQHFADTNRGTFTEISPSATVHVLVDDLGPATSGAPPASQRFYRIRAARP